MVDEALFHADHAFLDGKMRADVTLGIDGDGRVSRIEPGRLPGAESFGGILLPGMTDVHSHSFQRAMAGLCERAGPEGDDFWSWREVMYRFLDRIGPEETEAIAAQLYVELLKQGYTHVGEFHYLHNDPAGQPYADPAELSHRIRAAADNAGIRLALMPVLYQHSQFGGLPPTPGQRRFVKSLDDFALLIERTKPEALAPHSLRAVGPEALAEIVALAGANGLPVHIHAAEQVKEVEDCVAWSGQRPVEWLLDHAPVDAGWCLVHCTHLSADERRRLAVSRAVVGLCPSTEANLGDGFFDLPEFLAEGGFFAIGSDSNVTTDPAEELRWLDYAQRLRFRSRNITEREVGRSIGTGLFRRALEGGAQALALKAGRADFIILDPDHPALTGRTPQRILDGWIFQGGPNPVRHVMVGGRWVVRDGHHVREDEIARAYRKAIANLLEDS